MSWNYRLVKEDLDELDDSAAEWFTVREVFYNEDGSIHLVSEEPVSISAESPDEIRELCQNIIACLDKEMLRDGEIEFDPNKPGT